MFFLNFIKSDAKMEINPADSIQQSGIYRMRAHYRAFTQISADRRSHGTFNLTCVFTTNSVDLFRTPQTLVRLNVTQSRVEYLLDDRIVGFIHVSNLSHISSFSVQVDPNQMLRLQLNGHVQAFRVANYDIYELFLAESLQIEPNIGEVCINGRRIEADYAANLTNFRPKSVVLSTPMITTRTQIKILDESFLFAVLHLRPTPVLVISTVVAMLGLMLVALISILVNIFTRRQKRRQNHNGNHGNRAQSSPSSTASSASSLSALTHTNRIFQQDNYLEYDSMNHARLVDEFRSTNQILAPNDPEKTSILAAISRRLSSVFARSKRRSFNSQADLIMPAQQQQQTFQSKTHSQSHERKESVFDVNDLYHLKDNLNWMPSFELYKNVFNDLESFPSLSNYTNTTATTAVMTTTNSSAASLVNEVAMATNDGVLILENETAASYSLAKQYGQQTFV